MKKKFRYNLIYMSCFFSLFAGTSAHADNSVQASIGGTHNSGFNPTVGANGEIILQGRSSSVNRPTPANNMQNSSVINSDPSPISKPPVSQSIQGNNSDEIIISKNSPIQGAKTPSADNGGKAQVGQYTASIGKPTSDPQGGNNGDFKIGKPYFAETGVLTYSGDGKKQIIQGQGGDQIVLNGSSPNNNDQSSERSERTQGQSTPQATPISSSPDHHSNEIIPQGVNFNDMPTPQNLPPLPGQNGNVMLPISMPTSKAADLPPLPDYFVPNLGVSVGTTDQGGINNQGIPVNPDGEPINYKGMNSIFVKEKNNALSDQFVDYMRQAGDKFLDIGIPMKVIIVNTDEFELRRFIANNILRSNSNNFESIDTGLTSILSLNTKINNFTIPVCYVVLKDDQQTSLMQKYIAPLSKIAKPDAVAAYLVAHQVSLCMDNLERYKVLPKVNTWFPDSAKTVGLSPDAIRRLYPYGMTYNEYSRTTMHLYNDLAQRQYQERIGDIFGLYLSLYAGYDPNIVNGVIALRKGLKDTSSYNTYDAIKDLNTDYETANKTNVKTLWQSARRLQEISGVDSSLQFGVPEKVYSALLNKQSDMSESSLVDEFRNNESKNKKIEPKKQINFDDVSTFGGDGLNGDSLNNFGASSNRITVN